MERTDNIWCEEVVWQKLLLGCLSHQRGKGRQLGSLLSTLRLSLRNDVTWKQRQESFIGVTKTDVSLQHAPCSAQFTWKLRLLNLEGPILPRFSFFFFSSALIFFHSAAESPSGMYTILRAPLFRMFTGRSWVDGGANARPPVAPAKAATAIAVETVRILMPLLGVRF